jgi:hypothetical protein
VEIYPALPRSVLFYCLDLRKTPAVPFFASKSRGDKCSHNLHRKLGSNHTSAQTEHVAIIMFSCLPSGVRITAERCANAAHLVCRNGRSNTTATHKYPNLSSAVLYCFSNQPRIVRIIVRY